ncbi:MAG: hypothetical protein K0Q55_2425 [Verrucomicrobia bacterium]|jgi:type II secretory pathway pseudopilin PulG|nr:hypothetical protein [Verrucomicrobiota bacterium]
MSESTESPESASAGKTWGPIIVCLLIIGLLAAIAVPNFMKARTTTAKSACVANLKQIDGAIKQWALESRKTDADPVDIKEAVKFLKGGVLPKCPADGVYSPGITIGNKPTCSMDEKLPEGHRLP